MLKGEEGGAGRAAGIEFAVACYAMETSVKEQRHHQRSGRRRNKDKVWVVTLKIILML